jgi:hypothetical protein
MNHEHCRDIATVPRRAIEEAKPHHASIPALIPPADPVRLNPIQPNPWAETLGVFFIAAVIALAIYMFAIGLLSLAGYLGAGLLGTFE